MAGRTPDEIWQDSIEESDRRLGRGTAGLLSTGLVGGFDVMFGVLALVTVSGALLAVAPEELSHIGGSLFFGIGFVFLVVGRSELFTENFLVPLIGVWRGRDTPFALARLWLLTLIGNVAGLLLLAFILTRGGIVPESTHEAAGQVADTFAARTFLPAFLSAVLAGTVMTLFTWMTEAVEFDFSRIVLALLVGFVLAAPSLNHAVVSVGEMSFGVMAGTAKVADTLSIVQNLGVAILGNVLGGVGFVTLQRALQVHAEPGDESPGGGPGSASEDPNPAGADAG